MGDDASLESAAAVPDRLLAPLLEAAADTLRDLEPEDVPSSLRHLRGFDRRGLTHGPAPRQLRRAFEQDAAFRERVNARFAALPAVAPILERWSADAAWEIVEEAARRKDLPLLASILSACRPMGSEFGLGVVVAFDEVERRARGDEAAARARGRELEEITEARRRADVARMAAETEAAHATAELRDERQARRMREDQARAEVAAAKQRAAQLAAEVEQARSETDDERGRGARERQRRAAVETELATARAEVAELRARMDHAASRLDARDAEALAGASTTARRLASELDALRLRIASPSSGTRIPAPPPVVPVAAPPLVRRVRPTVPPGVVATSKPGIDAMLRTPDVVVVIDGYNVTKRAWPEESVSDQREWLCNALTQFEHRSGCSVLCVFDGDGTIAHPGIRRGGIRVVFSAAGEEADEVVVRGVRALPKRIPVVVVSSDAWIREHAEDAGAVVVPADAFIAALGRR